MDVEALIKQAQAESGLQARGESYRPGLNMFVEDFNRSTTVTDVGRATAERMVIETLIARFAIEDRIARFPEILDVPVVSPVFILGMPRAGTTLLLNLLAHDPQHRVYWNWEANREMPPVQPVHLRDDPRIARKVAEVNAALASGALDHRLHVELGDEPGECVWLMGQDFKSYPWLVLTAAPNYFDWLYGEADMLAAYRHHKRALQAMQTFTGGKWLLKFPSHAPFLDALLSVYPDARIVLTHRDPIKPLGSSCSASHHITAQLNAGLDPRHVGQETTRVIATSLQKMGTLREAHAQVPVYDFHYLRFVADPIAEVHCLYDFLGQTLPPEVERRMQAALDAHLANRRQAGAHQYSLAQFGISRDALPRIFDDYVERFGIVRELD